MSLISELKTELRHSEWSGLTELMFEFDPKTHTMEKSDIPTRPLWFDTKTQTMLYTDVDNGKTVLLQNGRKTELDIDVGTFATVFNNKLFVRDTGKWYDLSDMSEHDMGKYDENEYWEVRDYFDGCYILTNYKNNAKLTEDELLALDKG